MPFGIGPLELVIILVIVLLIFGGKKLPEMGRSLGSGMREFKKGVSGEKVDEPQETVTATQAADPALTQAQPPAQATTTQADETTPSA